MRSRERAPVSGQRGRVSLPRRQNLAEGVYEALKELIMDGIFPQGSRVNLDEVARELQVSQSPLREALVRLESEGLVIKEPFRGYSTAPVLSRSELEDLFEFRFVVEPWAAARAATSITDEGRALLATEMASTPQAPIGTSYHESRGMASHDARLHDLIQTLGGNAHMRAAFQRTHCHLHIIRLHYRGGMGEAALGEHHRIVEAISSGDPEAAAAAMRAHLEASQARLLPVYDDAWQGAEEG
ncbi:GntR family transcriptional regulator [Actinopolymorpha alba]|uniref:GntR family transcriptional regulator n=1 Tax=Actinopolymorpha alba TaxID=533267 RepID=UPI0004783D8B|nr:GntR family transcriptional regulator [Actinopolymorpha alba]